MKIEIGIEVKTGEIIKIVKAGDGANYTETIIFQTKILEDQKLISKIETEW